MKKYIFIFITIFIIAAISFAGVSAKQAGTDAATQADAAGGKQVAVQDTADTTAGTTTTTTEGTTTTTTTEGTTTTTTAGTTTTTTTEGTTTTTEAPADQIIVTNPVSGQEVTSPLVIEGRARGVWFFEATFPVMLLDGRGNILARGFVTAQGDWMTENFVPFRGELSFSTPSTARGILVLEKANPSGLPENAGRVEIPVRFAVTTTTAPETAEREADEEAECDLKVAMRELWSIHGWYTREAVMSAILDQPNLDAVVTALLDNQEEIGDAFGQFYGTDNGDTLTELLIEHINIALEVVNAAEDQNDSELSEADQKWRENASDIAEFLSDINPNWSFEDASELLNDHLDLLTDMVVALIEEDYIEGVRTNDIYIDEILLLADFLTEGIIKQFPERFLK